MPFKKGQSGNPGGRPKLHKDLKAAAQAECGEAIKLFVQVLKDKKARTVDRMKAAENLLDRGYGRPVQQQNIDMTVKNDIASFLSTCGLGAVEADSDELGDEPSSVRH